LREAINIFCNQLQTSITEGKADWNTLNLVISTLVHLNPSQTSKHKEYHFLWLANILDSGHPDRGRWLMATGVVRLIGGWFNYAAPEYFPPSWIPPPFGFLSLCEKHSPAEGLIALRILSFRPGYSDFGTMMILPVLTPILVPTHPLKSRGLALRVFCGIATGWFSPQMENVPDADLYKLLQAVGDPFQLPRLPVQDRNPWNKVDDEPWKATVILVEFASSDLWRNHLRPSNFTSCEEILFTEAGRRSALKSMFSAGIQSRQELLCTPVKIIAAIRCLEELHCLNTAEVVILWAWTTGVVDVVDYDAWRLIEGATLDFYQTHGTRRLAALSRHITNATMEDAHLVFFLTHYQGPPYRVGSFRKLTPSGDATYRWNSRYFELLRVSQVCQLSRLYRLFGCNPITWKKMVSGGEVGEEVGTSLLGRSVKPVQFTNWVCDYP